MHKLTCPVSVQRINYQVTISISGNQSLEDCGVIFVVNLMLYVVKLRKNLQT